MADLSTLPRQSFDVEGQGAHLQSTLAPAALQKRFEELAHRDASPARPRGAPLRGGAAFSTASMIYPGALLLLASVMSLDVHIYRVYH